jgi:L-threonylcarbamoyladenylate synthase
MNDITDTTLLGATSESVSKAAWILSAGGIGVFPTDTVYGVGALALNDDAIRRIYTIKQRPADKPLQLLLANIADIASVAEMTPEAQLLAESFLPGGLTLILRCRPVVSDAVTAGGETVAVRVPDQPMLKELILALGAPLAATSANRSGQPAPVEASEAAKQLGALVDFVLDGGRCAAALESTIIDLSGPEPTLIRSGAVPLQAIEGVLGRELRR